MLRINISTAAVTSLNLDATSRLLAIGDNAGHVAAVDFGKVPLPNAFTLIGPLQGQGHQIAAQV